MIELLTVFFSLLAVCFGSLLLVWLIMFILSKDEKQVKNREKTV